MTCKIRITFRQNQIKFILLLVILKLVIKNLNIFQHFISYLICFSQHYCCLSILKFLQFLILKKQKKSYFYERSGSNSGRQHTNEIHSACENRDFQINRCHNACTHFNKTRGNVYQNGVTDNLLPELIVTLLQRIPAKKVRGLTYVMCFGI